jgi:hypothetical protein
MPHTRPNESLDSRTVGCFSFLIDGIAHSIRQFKDLGVIRPSDRRLIGLRFSTSQALLNVTRDERFVTARYRLQSLWKVGVVGEAQRKVMLKGLVAQFQECAAEKNCTPVRYDILVWFSGASRIWSMRI